MFPEFLFKLTARDEQVTPLEAITYAGQTANANASVVATADYTVPMGRVLALTSCGVYMGSAAGVTPQTGIVYAVDPSGNQAIVHAETYTAAAGAIAATGGGVVYLPENFILRGQGTWSGAGLFNSINLTFTGVLIPRGNFAV